MDQCKRCGSYAINPHEHGRDPNEDLDLCDVCYWRKRAEACQWRDIETAPKDKTVIDLWVPSVGRMPDYQWDKCNNIWSNTRRLMWVKNEAPTHWMPIPLGPDEEDED